MKDFEELPFYERPDLTPYLIHLTKNTKMENNSSAFDNLLGILQQGIIYGSGKSGYIRGGHTATCFMDIPFSSLKYVLNAENTDPDNPRYEPFGVAFSKPFGYDRGCRPVLYLSNQEIAELHIPKEELWRVVRLEAQGKSWLSWLHEREWRKKGNFKPPINAIALVETAKDAKKLQEMILDEPDDFKIKPRAILPLEIICPGLRYI